MKLFIFDLDGTLYLNSFASKEVINLIYYLQKKYLVIFFTNASGNSLIQVQERLLKLGFNCEIDHIYTSSYMTALYLRENNISDVFVIGTTNFLNEISSFGISIIQNSSAKNLVVGLDNKFTYSTLSIALHILLNNKDGKFICCNEDKNFPVNKNILLPGCGAIVGAISACSGRKPDYVVGKPNTYTLQKIVEKYNISKDEIIVVGDSLESDIQMAKNFGCKFLLVNHKTIVQKVYKYERSLQ